MIGSIEFYLNGDLHRLIFLRNEDDPSAPILHVWLKCPKCGSMGRLDNDHVNGRVSVLCDYNGCKFHETHNYLGLAKNQIEALINHTKT